MLYLEGRLRHIDVCLVKTLFFEIGLKEGADYADAGQLFARYEI